jgi:hypothetical protein
MSENENTRVVDDRICEDISTNVTLSTPSVVSCDIQVAFGEREPPILQPAKYESLKAKKLKIDLVEEYMMKI